MISFHGRKIPPSLYVRQRLVRVHGSLRPFSECLVSTNEDAMPGGVNVGVSKTAKEKQVEIEFLYLDLDVCTRCKGTDANLETALRILQEVLRASGTNVSTRKMLVDSEETARKFNLL